jgi:hypothetical protein
VTGYRESSYEPKAYARPGPALRPFNWVQWTGVLCVAAGVALDIGYFASRLGWIRPLLEGPALAIIPIFIGIGLVNSRRQAVTDPAPELAADRRRWLLIVTVICTVILGAAIAIDFLGAR